MTAYIHLLTAWQQNGHWLFAGVDQAISHFEPAVTGVSKIHLHLLSHYHVDNSLRCGTPCCLSQYNSQLVLRILSDTLAATR